MSTLYLIRHGQASFLQDDYDVLSERGVEQSRRLGTYAAEHGLRFDAIYSGPRKRQLDTATHMLDSARAAGADLPDPEVADAFDEYPFDAIMKDLLPRLIAEDPEIGELMRGDPLAGEQRRRLSKVIERVTTRWSCGDLPLADGIETYEHFFARVTAGLDDIMRRQGRGKTIAVVTSGGPISVSIRRALGLEHEITWKTTWVIRNGSISEFMYRPDAFSLVSFNATPHLRGELITYR